MGNNVEVALLNLPNPPNQILWRDTAGGFGTSLSCPSKLEVKNSTPLHPFLPYASAVFTEASIEFKVIDSQRLNLNNQQTLEAVEKINPKIVFSIISLPSMRNDLEVLKNISKSLENVTTVGVGTACHIIPDIVLSENKIDILLRNSYPYIDGLVDLVKLLRKGGSPKNNNGLSYIENGKILHNPNLPDFNFDRLPTPNYNDLPLDGYDTYPDKTGKRHPYVLVVDSKGCPYGCVYCAYPLGYGREFTFRPPAKIVDEIEQLHLTRHIDVFAFKGQSFAYSKTHAKKVCDEIAKRNLKITWFCESRVDEVNLEYLQTMKNAGCERIHYGVETGDPEIIKTAKPGVTLDLTRRAFKMTKQNDIFTQAHVVLGWPNDTRETLDNTRKFLLELNPDVLNLNFLTPYPGTAIFGLAERKSLLLTRNWSNFTSHTVVMRTMHLNARQIMAAKNKIVRDFSLKKLKELVFDLDLRTLTQQRSLAGRMKALSNKVLFPSID
jgi:anaerobic magnesium-protoporphyrin IX monomethyl ester cyclase